MAENDTNEEYQFTELDPLNPRPLEEEGEVSEGETSVAPSSGEPSSNIKRNAIIAVGAFVLIMLLYKLVGSFFTEKKPTRQIPSLEVTSPTPVVPAQPSVVEAPPPVAPATTIPNPSDVQPDVHVKLSALETGQENLGSQVSSFNGQLENVNSSLRSLTDKIDEMNTTISQLNAKLDDQSRRVEDLAKKPEPVVKVVRIKRTFLPLLTYRIQAVIPGRAWLIASNGTTVTVRVGTRLAGYGVVRGIDVSLGRVTTSSGKIIRFGQNDS